jgi:DNA-binding HxlR family transcriptional regulator
VKGGLDGESREEAVSQSERGDDAAPGAASSVDFCPVRAAIQLLQEKWTLHIVRALLEAGPLGFNELGRRVGGCNPATLAQRLDHLVAQGLVAKTVHSTMPPRTSYALTCAGVELQQVVEAIADWGRRHLAPAAGEPSALDPTSQPASRR